MPGNDANCVLLLACDGTDTSTTIPDSSVGGSHGNASVNGTAQLDTAVKKWGTAGLLLDGNSDWISYADSADWDIAADDTQDYTIDLWVKHTDHVSEEIYINQYADSENRWQLLNTDIQAGIGFRITTGGADRIAIFGGEVTDTDWHHVAVCKVCSAGPTVLWGIYKDGTQVAYGSMATEYNITGVLNIGARNSGVSYFDGSMDEIRIYKGNYFGAAPNSGLTDTITVPTEAYDTSSPTTRRVFNIS